jgi:nitrogen fixation NifU-like protein
MSSSMDDFMGSIYRRIGKTGHGIPQNSIMKPPDQERIMGRMDDSSCSGQITGSCGETMEIRLKVDGEKIIDADFFTDGCRFSVVCGFIATQFAKGKTMDEAAQVEGDTILMAFDEIPQGENHCAYLAAETLHAAIHDWMLKK